MLFTPRTTREVTLVLTFLLRICTGNTRGLLGPVATCQDGSTVSQENGLQAGASVDHHILFPGRDHHFAIQVTTSDHEAAACAEMGEDDKQKRYKSKALPMVLETFGRFGPESEKVLDLLAMAAGHTARCKPVLHVWRDRLRRALWFATADAALRALERGVGHESPD